MARNHHPDAHFERGATSVDIYFSPSHFNFLSHWSISDDAIQLSTSRSCWRNRDLLTSTTA
jgi:hypothetical protein